MSEVAKSKLIFKVQMEWDYVSIDILDAIHDLRESFMKTLAFRGKLLLDLRDTTAYAYVAEHVDEETYGKPWAFIVNDGRIWILTIKTDMHWGKGDKDDGYLEFWLIEADVELLGKAMKLKREESDEDE